MKIKIEQGDTLWINDNNIVILVKTGREGKLFLGSSGYINLSRGLHGLVNTNNVYKVSFIENDPIYKKEPIFKDHINKLCALRYEIRKEEHSIGMTLIDIPFDIEELPEIATQIYLYKPHNYNKIIEFCKQDYKYVFRTKNEQETRKERHAIELQLD